MSSQPQDIIADALYEDYWPSDEARETVEKLAEMALTALHAAGYALVKIDDPRDRTPDDPAVLHARAVESARRILAGEGEVAVPVEALRHVVLNAKTTRTISTECDPCSEVLARLDAS